MTAFLIDNHIRLSCLYLLDNSYKKVITKFSKLRLHEIHKSIYLFFPLIYVSFLPIH